MPRMRRKKMDRVTYVRAYYNPDEKYHDYHVIIIIDGRFYAYV